MHLSHSGGSDGRSSLQTLSVRFEASQRESPEAIPLYSILGRCHLAWHCSSETGTALSLTHCENVCMRRPCADWRSSTDRRNIGAVLALPLVAA